MLTLNHLNEQTETAFTHTLGEIFEHSPWIAAQAAQARPFSSLHQLHNEMVNIVKNSTPEQQIALIKAHPNLGDRVEMSNVSINEQKGAGLKDLSEEEYDQFIAMNNQYMTRFEFPFILAVRGKNKDEIYQAMETRVANDPETEFQTALVEIYKIAKLRLHEKVIQQ